MSSPTAVRSDLTKMKEEEEDKFMKFSSVQLNSKKGARAVLFCVFWILFYFPPQTLRIDLLCVKNNSLLTFRVTKQIGIIYVCLLTKCQVFQDEFVAICVAASFEVRSAAASAAQFKLSAKVFLFRGALCSLRE